VAAGILAAGCGAKPEVMVRDRIVNVAVPEMCDTIVAQTSPPAPLLASQYDPASGITRGPKERGDAQTVSGVKINGKDTVVDIRYYPGRERIVYRIRPDTVRMRLTDTLTVFKNVVKEEHYPWLKKAGLIGIGAVLMLVFMVVWMLPKSLKNNS
jgi:hypothetical protein